MEQKLFTKNFILLIGGQINSLFANLILKFALSMYVLEVTGSASIFAAILALATIPTILLTPLGGILADRLNRRTIMITLDLLTCISVLCAAIFFSVNNGIHVISILMIILSILGAFETPTVQACVPQMQAGDNIMKGNAVINQIAAVVSLIAPIIGSVLYVTYGLRPVMIACIICFFLTALLECMIKLSPVHHDNMHQGILAIVKHDFFESMHFITQKHPEILKLLLFIALTRFFVIGTVIVGLPYIVRNILKLSATYYGLAESTLGIATIIGSIAAGFLTGTLKTNRLSLTITILGVCFIPVGLIFLFLASTAVRYIITVTAFCGIQATASIFSIFIVSIIQQKTPNHLIGKIMAYTSAISLCIQPLGQALYGLLLDEFHNALYLVLIPTGVIVCLIGLCAARS